MCAGFHFWGLQRIEMFQTKQIVFWLLLLFLGDLALGLAMTENRAKHIAFSFPYLPLALNILVEKEGGSKTGEKHLCIRNRKHFTCFYLGSISASPFRKAAGNRA